MRLEVVADLYQSTVPIFDSHRHLLACNKGFTIDTKTGKLTPTRPSMLNTKILDWPFHEWKHPCAAEYRQVVSDIIAHWANNPKGKPDLQMIRGEVPDDAQEDPPVLHWGVPELERRARQAFSKIEYLKTRLDALRGDVDQLIYKEQWLTRIIGAVHHLRELLYTYG